jgi:hypothetical protein
MLCKCFTFLLAKPSIYPSLYFPESDLMIDFVYSAKKQSRNNKIKKKIEKHFDFTIYSN